MKVKISQIKYVRKKLYNSRRTYVHTRLFQKDADVLGESDITVLDYRNFSV